MYNIKGFLSIKPFIDNIPGELSPIGELSTHSMTYSMELGYYGKETYPNTEFVAFSVKNNDVEERLPDTYQDELLPIFDWIYSQCVDGIFNNDTADDFRTRLLSAFTNLDDVTVGEMIATGYLSTKLPRFIYFKLTGMTDDNMIRVWLSDTTFQQQYDEYTILVVPPVEDADLDTFIDGTHNEVQQLMDDDTARRRMQRIEAKRQQRPATAIRTEMYDWADPAAPTETINTVWSVVIFGAAGNNIDTVQEEIQSYVLAQSVHNAGTWQDYIPDLFLTIEFVLVPYWHNWSNENLTDGTSKYSPTVRHRDVLPIVKETTGSRYTDAHVEDNLHSSMLQWKNASFAVVASADNSNEIRNFKAAFHDYIVTATTSIEWDDMSLDTREWVEFITPIFVEAERMTKFSTMPANISRIERQSANGVELMFASGSFQGVNYLVLSKESYLNDLTATSGL